MASLPCFPANLKDAEWKTGTLTDVSFEKDSRLVGAIGSSGGVMVQKRHDSTYYLIESGDVVYVAKRMLTHKHDKQLNLTVNTPVRFTIKGNDFYLQDEDGKVHKLALEKKTLKIAVPQHPDK